MVLAVSAQKTTRAKSPQVVSRSEVPEEGLEPTPTYVDWILNPARLPIPPLWPSDVVRVESTNVSPGLQGAW